MKNLTDEELAGITGGTFTAEAQEWITRNKETIISRSGNKSLVEFAISYGSSSSTVYDVAAIKATLKNFGYNCDDLP